MTNDSETSMNGVATRTRSVASTTESTTVRRTDTTYLVDGRNGKMPWGWPRIGLFVALPLFLLLALIATPWAVSHIEGQLVDEARADLEAAGIDSSDLDIDFDYRDGEATGVLPAGVATADAEAVVDDGLLRDFEVTAAATAAPETAATPEPATDTEPAAPATGPVEVRAAFDGTTVVVIGTVLSEAHRVAVIEAAEAGAPGAPVDDRLVVSGLDAEVDGADDRIADLAAALGGLGGAQEWSARLTDRALDVDATVTDAETAAAIEGLGRQLTSVPTVVTVIGGQKSVETEISSLQTELDRLIPDIREHVVFASGSDVLTPEAMAVLDEVVAAMERHPSPVVEVAGHTDDVGDAEANAALSQRRAASVRAYLVDQGIAAERLSSLGVGEDEPVDTNDTPEGRANNRRVELTALAGF